MPTKIEWCDETINPLGWGCYGPNGTPEQPKRCSYCYAFRLAKRKLRECKLCQEFVPHEHPDELEKPEQWRKPRRIFVESMGDLFGDGVDEDYLFEIFSRLLRCYQHTKIILTKQATRMRQKLIRLEHGHELFEEICLNEEFWFLVSITNQPDADDRIINLLQTPASIRGVSIEPLLGSVSLFPWIDCRPEAADARWLLTRKPERKLDWVVVGAQTGPGAIPPRRGWVTSIVEQCQAANVPIFMKNNLAKYYDGELIQEFPRAKQNAP